MTEFEIIEQYFHFSKQGAGVITGIGDDAAVVQTGTVPIAISVDTLVAGVHFPLTTAAADIGYKALAVNLSDLAAMGAKPLWFTLSLVLPEQNHAWLEGFSNGLSELASQFNLALIGGDTTRGPLTITIQILGSVETSVLRSGARPDEEIYVTGSIGDAAIGLLIDQSSIHSRDHSLKQFTNSEKEFCLARLNRPTPRVSVGRALRNSATAMIDCSDGFAADLSHILTSSGVGAKVAFHSLPLSSSGASWISAGGNPEQILSGGDDYELIFTAPKTARSEIARIAVEKNCAITRVGSTTKDVGLRIHGEQHRPMSLTSSGYNHFNDA